MGRFGGIRGLWRLLGSIGKLGEAWESIGRFSAEIFVFFFENFSFFYFGLLGSFGRLGEAWGSIGRFSAIFVFLFFWGGDGLPAFTAMAGKIILSVVG